MLKLVDIQNGVDEHEQVVALGRDVAERVFELFLVVFVLAGGLRHAEHDIERRSDIVTHFGKEVLLGSGGFLGLFECRSELAGNLLLLVAALDRLRIHQKQHQNEKDARARRNEVHRVVKHILVERWRRGLLQVALHDLRAGGLGDACKRLGPQTVQAVVLARVDAHFELQHRTGDDL